MNMTRSTTRRWSRNWKHTGYENVTVPLQPEFHCHFSWAIRSAGLTYLTLSKSTLSPALSLILSTANKGCYRKKLHPSLPFPNDLPIFSDPLLLLTAGSETTNETFYSNIIFNFPKRRFGPELSWELGALSKTTFVPCIQPSWYRLLLTQR